MGNYLVKFGDYDLSDITEECSFSIDNHLGEQVVPDRHGLLINRLATVSIRKIRLRGLIYDNTTSAIRNRASAIEAALGSEGQYFYVPLDDKVYFAYKTKFTLTPILLGNGQNVGIIDMEFVCDTPFIIDATNPVVVVEREIDYFKNIQIITYQGGPHVSSQTLYGILTSSNNSSEPTAIWDSDGGWVKLLTAGTDGSFKQVAGASSPAGNSDGIQYQQGPDWYGYWKTGNDVTNCKIIVGMLADLNNYVAVPTTKTSLMLFYYQTAAGTDNTNGAWETRTDNESVAAAKTTTNVTVQPNTLYKMRIDARDPLKIDFYINDALVSTHASNLPATNVVMGRVFYLRTNENAAKYFLFGRCYFEYN